MLALVKANLKKVKGSDQRNSDFLQNERIMRSVAASSGGHLGLRFG